MSECTGRIELRAADIGPRYSGQAVKVASRSPSAVRLLVPDVITVAAAALAVAAPSGQRSTEAFLHYLELLPRGGKLGGSSSGIRQLGCGAVDGRVLLQLRHSSLVSRINRYGVRREQRKSPPQSRLSFRLQSGGGGGSSVESEGATPLPLVSCGSQATRGGLAFAGFERRRNTKDKSRVNKRRWLCCLLSLGGDEKRFRFSQQGVSNKPCHSCSYCGFTLAGKQKLMLWFCRTQVKE